jgi:cAMP phosphodiesterase
MDAGTGLGELPLSTLTGIDHVFVTHAHVDHIAYLPLLIDAVLPRRAAPVTVHATDETLRTLESHIFNWSIWPDFTQLPSPERPSMRYSQVEVGQAVDLGNCRITPVPAEHTIPTVGFHLENGNASLVYCGDTTVCDPLWRAVNAIDNLKHLIIETAFDDAKLQLAERAGHLSPMLLAAELEKFQRPAEVYIDHIKPGLDETVMREIARQVRNRRPRALKRGQVLEL